MRRYLTLLSLAAMLALPVFAGEPIDEQIPEPESGQDVSAAVGDGNIL